MLTAVNPVVPPRTHLDVLADRVEQIDDDRQESSKRLHLEIKELRDRFEEHLRTHGQGPLDVMNLRFSPTVTVAIVAGILTLFGTLYSLSRDIDAVNKEQRLIGIKIEELKVETAKASRP